MSLESSIKETCDGLKVGRINERKKNAEKLKEYLSMHGVIIMLTENSLQKRGYTWNQLFYSIHDYILKEIEKYETSKTFESVTAPLCANLLSLCVAGANKGQAYIKCENIMEACLEVLKDSYQTKAIGDAYLNLLYRHVLPHEYYLNNITPATWDDLLDLCIASCLNNHSKLDDFTKLRLVLGVMKSGKNNGQFVIPLRNCLAKLKKVIVKLAGDKKVQEVVIEIVILLLETLSMECRLTMSAFVEKNLLSLLKFYDPNMEHKKKSLLFKMLCLTVTLHHPNGRSQGEDGSLANNWDLWNKHLTNILEVICLEINYLQKLRKQDQILKQCEHLYELAARVLFQKFKVVVPTENDECNSSKRQRIGLNNNKNFSDLIDELRLNHVPWLGIIHIYVKDYGSNIAIDDYFSLLSVLEVLITNTMNNLNWDIFEKLSIVVFHHLKSQLITRTEINNSILLSLWNACVRYSTSLTAAHKSLHAVIQCVLTLNVLKYQNVQTLSKLYLDKGMPVTTHSVRTLYYLFNKYYSKFNHTELRVKCLEWVTQGDIISVEINDTKELLLRIMANENVDIKQNHMESSEYNDLNNILFDSIDKGILFSEFEIEIRDIDGKVDPYVCSIEMIIIDLNMKLRIEKYLTETLVDYNEKIASKCVTVLEYTKFVHIMLTYFDIILKKSSMKFERVRESDIFFELRKSLKLLFSVVNNALENHGGRIADKVVLVKLIKDILITEFDSQLNVEIRSCIDQDYFHCINNILNTDTSNDEDVICDDDEGEMNSRTLRHYCILMLAAYCRKSVDYREEILELILDAKLYNFRVDSLCAFQCIELLGESCVEAAPIELLFTFMQQMCKDLYRDSKASSGILKALLSILDRVWIHDSLRQNCFIMIKSYLLRCEKLYYPPKVAGLIYEGAARVAILNRQQGADATMLEEALVDKLKGDIHTIRLYCCYLLKLLIVDYSHSDIQTFLKGLLEIFVINVSDVTESILKDESANRTLTVFHCYLALVQTKMPFAQSIVTEILHFKKEKSLDLTLVKKNLNKIVKTIGEDSIESYLSNNMLSVLYTWFSKNNSVEDIPIDLFGCAHMDEFVESYMKLLVAGDILWRSKGIVGDSRILKQIVAKRKLSVESVIETCFCEIIILCLPYIVVDKYKIDFTGSENPRVWSQSMANANKVFRSIGQMLENEKWTNLFVENLGELVLFAASRLCDYEDAEKQFQQTIPRQARAYYYPKKVFSAILNYFDELTDGNIMQYLCENQPLAIFKILFKLWDNVLCEHIVECRILAMHAYVTFIENLPLEFSSDAYVCNYATKSFANAIKNCQNNADLRVYTKGLKIVVNIFLPEKVSLVRKSVCQVVPILVMKVESGCTEECASMLNYLVHDVKVPVECSQDVTDFMQLPSQTGCGQETCSTLDIFIDKLKVHKSNLTCPSYETLRNMHQFLKMNKNHVKKWYTDFESKGFSEDCGTSIVHQTIRALNTILRSVGDSKVKIAACNCLSVIGMYDLKTLVTVPPEDTRKVTTLSPKNYFTSVLVKTLAEMLFDEDPKVTSKVVETLNCLLKNRDNANLDLGDIDENILKPFSNSLCNMSNDVTINYEYFDKYRAEFSDGIFLLRVTMSPNGNMNHEDWLKSVTTTLLCALDSGSNYIKILQDICSLKTNVCSMILPSLIGLLIFYSPDSYVQLVGEHIIKFFNYIWEQTFDCKLGNSGDSPAASRTFTVDHGHKMVIQFMLDIVDFVRLQSNFYNAQQGGPKNKLNYLKLKYEQVSWAAAVADQYLAAIYYGEQWASEMNNGVPPNSPECTTNLTGGEYIQQIFRKCYVSIGDIDAIEGCGTAHLTLEYEKRKYLSNTGQYCDALLLFDVALAGAPEAESQRGLVTALHRSAMHHLALTYINTLPETDQFNDVKYECLSFLGDWSVYVDTKELVEKLKQPNCNPNSVIKAFRYACLKDTLSLQTTPDLEKRLELPLDQAKLAVSRLCQKLNMENCQSVYNVLGKLHLFTDIEDYSAVRTNKLRLKDLLSKWQLENVPCFNNFKHLEALISQRVLILEHAANTCNDFFLEIISLQIQYAELGLCNNRIEMSQRLMAVVKKLHSSDDVTLIESQISWAKGHKEIALSLLRNIVGKQSFNVKLNAESLRQYALWMAESKRENARDIIDKYLQKSLQVLMEDDHKETRLKVYHDIAKFADTEYKQVVSYMNSATFEMKVKCMQSMKGTASSLKSTQQRKSLTTDQRKAFFTNDRFRALEEAEIANTKAEKERFLDLAMRYYLLSLRQCEENNLSIFRLISLWLDNPQFKFDDGTVFEDLMQGIPSRKFITVLPQLVPRLTDDDSEFARILTKIISRCSREHPHHTLPLVLSLQYSECEGPRAGRRPPPRARAAAALLATLRTEPTLSQIIPQMEHLCDATINFANYGPECKATFQKQKIPNSQSIHKLLELDAIPIPTATVPIDSRCQYLNIPTIHAFDNSFELVGGINFPKKIKCTDSTGAKRILLIKGKDDLRQDAVMQQVFNIVNTLLEKNPVTSTNKLLIRTYKVVPMSCQSGVLEWCEGTMPLGGYLAGKGNNGAHARYRPQDISCSEARSRFSKSADQPNKVKLRVFKDILQKFKPVFHYFFTEHYFEPVTWYERRLAYIKSVAASSMVGYILGLGDRHVQNILIDKKTAEVIHIDFGIAFDQGKTLHTPETVPFRLTQDMIAGFGSSGVEGIFRRCCEKTMQLLRDNQEILLTILKVLLCDPLYTWTVTPSSTQQNDGPSNNDDTALSCAGESNSGLAERALLTVSSKLSGTEGGTAGGVAVPGQVATLLHAATDPVNLCRLFHGWQPYL